eukprot:TRINITY_DN112_c0_g1_i3.p1 TRINITY_DN112_c0_g1~~TRINITY_DN112_c0_g1_i3.p1  ORF type:complete len:441 (-),score=94.77 TRINITY_DN112_c0_g1_i3:337-1659(-)
MSVKIFTYPNNPRVWKSTIAAQFVGLKIEEPSFEFGKDNKTREFLAFVNPLGKVPAMQTEEGSVWESNAMARYVARSDDNKAGLYGASKIEAAQVDQWIDYASNEIDTPAGMWVYPILGYLPYDRRVCDKAKEDMHKALATLDKHLASRTFLVGQRITLADIVVLCALYWPLAMVIDPAFRAPYTHFVRWVDTLVHQPQFAAVIGDFKFAETMAVAPSASASASADKKEDKKEKKEEKKEKKEEKKEKAAAAPAAAPAAAAASHAAAAAQEEEEESYEEKPKGKNPLDLLPPSKFVLDEWKRKYSNTKKIREEAVPWFWDNYDPEGFCMYFAEYKYNDELNKLFMTCNLVGGFVQRLDNLRKYGFGNVLIFGKEPALQIRSHWVFRGKEIPPMMTECEDYVLYNWTPVDINNPEHREQVANFMTWDGFAEGEPADGKVFK